MHDADAISHPVNRALTTQLKDLEKSLPLRVLSPDDWAHWQRRGYVIVRGAVPPEQAAETAEILWKFEQKDADDPSTWHTAQRRDHVRAELNNSGMVEIYHHQRMWDNRQTQRVYDAFVDIWDRTDLWVTIDRANLNPPRQGDGPAEGFIHWDVNTAQRPLPIGVQGVLSLAPQDAETGGFQAVPWLFQHFDDWVADQPDDRDPLMPDATGLVRENIEMAPGDLLIFNSLLAHGVRPNTSKDRVRLAQYISMQPAEPENAAERAERIRLWKEIEPPNRPDFPGDPRGWEKAHQTPADLTPLGRRLLGLDDW